MKKEKWKAHQLSATVVRSERVIEENERERKKKEQEKAREREKGEGVFKDKKERKEK